MNYFRSVNQFRLQNSTFIFMALKVFSFYTCHNWFAFAFFFLTGSERVRETKSVGGTFTESQNINKSLLTLGEFVMTWFHILPADGFSARSNIACVASVSVWFRSKERPRNGILDFDRARNETRAKKMKLPLSSFTGAIFRAVLDSHSLFFAPKPHRNACYAG